MDRRERVFDPEETIRMALDDRLSRVWTCLPGVIQKFDRTKNTVEVQLAINGRVRQTDGTWKSIQMPKIVDCPVVWPSGGGMTMVFDLTPGVDECLVHFSARCIDSWWSQGFTAAAAKSAGADGNPVNPANDPPEFRMHNLSDGFASTGPRSIPRALTVDPGVCRIRTDDDETYLEFNPAAKTMTAVFSGGITLNGVTIDSNGNLVSPTTLTGQQEVTAKTGAAAVNFSTHETSLVQPGAGTSGGPVPGT